MRKWRVLGKVCLFLLCFTLMMPCTTVVYATDDLTNEVDEANEDRFSQGSPWLDGADDSIYSNGVDTAEEEQDIEPDEPGMVEKYFSELLRNIASSLIALLENILGTSLDGIIYGRVGSGKPNSVNIFGFELRSGNPYGVTAAVCYSLLRSMAFVFLGIVFVATLAKSLWTGQTAQSREQIKSSIFSTAMKFSILMLMPFLFDVALYVRDVALYGVKEVTGQMVTGGATLSLAKAFLTNAERTGRFVDAVMYLGTILLTIYFAIIYIALAIDILIAFVAFPVLCLLHSPKRDLLGNWVMSVLSDIITPLLDAILLMVPLLTSMMLGDVIRGIAVIQMIMCMLIIPARNRIKSLLGIQSNERGGFLSAMGLLAMGRMIAGKAKGAVQRIAGIRSDLEKSRAHGEMAKVDEEEREALLGGFDRSGSDNRAVSDMEERERMAQLSGGTRDSAEMDGYGNGTPEVADLDDDMLQGGGQNDLAGMDEITDDTGIPEGMEMNETETEPAQDDTPETPAGTEEPLTRNEALRDLNKTMDTMQQKIDDLRVKKAAYQNQEKQIARKMLDHERGSDEYRELEKERADAALGAAETAEKIEEQSRKLNQLRQQEKELRGSDRGAVPTQFDEARARILCKRANIDNFEQPEFRGVLSNAQMEKLYRNRAIANAVKGGAAVAGAAAGGMLLGVGSVFLGTGAMQMGTVAGMTSGSAIGSTAVGAGIAGGRFVKAVGSRFVDSSNASPPVQPVTPPEASVPPVPTASPTPTPGGERIVPPEQPVPHQTQRVEREIVIEESQNPTGVGPEAMGSVVERKVQVEIEKDSASALQQILTPAGGIRNSAAVEALRQANIETEKYILAARELEGTVLTKQQELAKRTEFQTEKLTDEIMKRLSNNPDYEPGTENYAAARETISDKVRAIIERQNRDLF
mgnify:FL=1